MKKIRILGVLLIILAVAVLAVGISADKGKDGDGAYAALLNEARESVVAVDSYGKAVKNAAATEKKVSSANGKLADAVEATAQAAADAQTLDAALVGGETGDMDVDALRAALAQLTEGAEGLAGFRAIASEDVVSALDKVESGVEAVSVLTDAKILALYQACVADAYDAVADAEGAIEGVREGALKVLGLTGDSETAFEGVVLTEEPVCESIEACHETLAVLAARAEELQGWADPMTEWVKSATDAANAVADEKVSLKDRFVIMLADNFIGVLFTAALLLAVALVMIFLAEPFKRQWVKNPVFSVGMALIVMLVLQTYALGFDRSGLHWSLGEVLV